VLGQAKINENLTKNLSYNDKMLKNTKLKNLSSSVQNQLSINKMVEKQIAQLAAAIPVADSGKTTGKSEISLEFILMVSMRFGKPQRQKSNVNLVDPPFVAKKEDPGCPTITCSIGPHTSTTPSATLEQASTSCPR
jgi:hypothetical protein